MAGAPGPGACSCSSSYWWVQFTLRAKSEHRKRKQIPVPQRFGTNVPSRFYFSQIPLHICQGKNPLVSCVWDHSQPKHHPNLIPFSAILWYIYMVILSYNEITKDSVLFIESTSSLKTTAWPTVFRAPNFTYDVELKLQQPVLPSKQMALCPDVEPFWCWIYHDC